MLSVLGLLLGIALLAYALVTPGLQFLESMVGGLLIGFCWSETLLFLKNVFGKN